MSAAACPATKWVADSGIGDTLNTLLFPIGKRIFGAHRRGEVDLKVYCTGPNAAALANLYTPMAPTETRVMLSAIPQNDGRVPPDWCMQGEMPEPPVDFGFTGLERADAGRILERVKSPRLMIQEVGGGRDGALQTRKLWGPARYRAIVERWKQSTGGGALEFGTHSTIGLIPAGSLRMALCLGSQVDCLLCPESAAKYLGPLFNVRAVVLWSRFHKFKVEDQWNQWYKAFDRSNSGRQLIVGIGRIDCKQSSTLEVWDLIQQVRMRP